MSSDNDVEIFIHKIVNNKIVSTIKKEPESLISLKNIQTEISIVDNNNIIQNYNDKKLSLNYAHFDVVDNLITIQEIPNNIDLIIKLNFPTLVKCQNCETHFPTKYQYQRHQCEYNALKSVFSVKNNIVIKAENVDEDCEEEENDDEEKENNLENPAKNAKKTNVCEFCTKNFVSENRLRIHKENHCKKAGGSSKFYRSDVTVWKCKKCHEVFSLNENAAQHLKQCEEIVDEATTTMIINEELETISTEILLQCEFCNKTFSNRNFLLLHQRKHSTTTNYECRNCDKTFDSYSLASSHWIKKCSEFSNVFYLPKLLYCEYCDHTFKSHEILYNHKIKKRHYTPKLHIHNNNNNNSNNIKVEKNIGNNKKIVNQLIQDVLNNFEVPVIVEEPSLFQLKIEEIDNDDDDEINQENSYFEKTNIKDEILPSAAKKRKTANNNNNNNNKKIPTTTIDDGFKYQCERCIKVFNSVNNLENHRNKEHVTSFCCEECGQTLGSAKALLIHCRAHKSLKPYVCDICGKSYSQTSHLWQHTRFHQGIKPFACPHEGCEARYTIRPDLKDHIRKVHTRERPFKCTVCNKCFLTGSVYYQHRLIHTNDRRYACETCNRRFFRADALNNHRRIHSNERPYACNVCGREFRQKSDKNKHVRTQHPDYYVPNN